MGREEDDLARPRPRQPDTRVVKGCCRVLDAPVVGWRGDKRLLVLQEEVVSGGCATATTADWKAERQHVNVHLCGEAFWRAGWGNPPRERD